MRRRIPPGGNSGAELQERNRFRARPPISARLSPVRGRPIVTLASALCFAVPAALALGATTGGPEIASDGIAFVNPCFTHGSVSYGKNASYRFQVINYRATALRNTRIDIYLGGGARFTSNNAYGKSPSERFTIAGSHAWTTVPLLKQSHGKVHDGVTWTPGVLVPKTAPRPWRLRVVVTTGSTTYTFRSTCAK